MFWVFMADDSKNNSNKIDENYLIGEHAVKEIVNNQIRDMIRIEQTLDFLLDNLIPYRKGKKEFEKLNEYYRDIDPTGANYYDGALAKKLGNNSELYVEDYRTFSEDAIPKNNKPGARAGNPIIDINLEEIREFQKEEYYRKQIKILRCDDKSNSEKKND